MVNPASIILPLYIYPLPGKWNPLFEQARAHPEVTFYAIVNPDTGPGEGSCPDASFIKAMDTLNSIPNIHSLGYVHTANAWDCGDSGSDICTCSAPLNEVKSNITAYTSWSAANCPGANGKDVHVDGIFIDEAPSDSSCLDYMRSATATAKQKSAQAPVMFNSGMSVDQAYWSIADYINVVEDTQAGYEQHHARISHSTWKHVPQRTAIIHSYAARARAKLHKEVWRMLNSKTGWVSALFVSSDSGYTTFPSNWASFCDAVSAVMKTNVPVPHPTLQPGPDQYQYQANDGEQKGELPEEEQRPGGQDDEQETKRPDEERPAEQKKKQPGNEAHERPGRLFRHKHGRKHGHGHRYQKEEELPCE